MPAITGSHPEGIEGPRRVATKVGAPQQEPLRELRAEDQESEVHRSGDVCHVAEGRQQKEPGDGQGVPANRPAA